ncbi:hypothetical protein MHYP_G00055830 [Metynnis hypsauchen]
MVLKQEQDKELKHERDTYRKQLAELIEQVRELQKDRDSYRKEMAAVREELRQRDSTVQSLREQLLSSNQQQSPPATESSNSRYLHPDNPSTQLQPPPSTSTSTSSQKPPPPSTPTSSQQSPPSQAAHLEPSAKDANRAEIRTTDQLDIALLIRLQRPKTHLAHHPTLDTACLYDDVQLFRELVPVFAKTLKDITLTRNVTTHQRKAGRNPNTRPSSRTPRPADGAKPQALHLRPRHHTPQYPEQPDRQMRHCNNPNLPTAPVPMAGTHTAPLPQGPAPPPPTTPDQAGSVELRSGC